MERWRDGGGNRCHVSSATPETELKRFSSFSMFSLLS